MNVFGQPTSAIADSAEWLTVVDRFGIVTERAVMLEALTRAAESRGAVDARHRTAVRRRRHGAPPSWRARWDLPTSQWDRPVGALDAAARTRVRLARALALDPAVLLLEHPTATVDRQDVSALGQRVRSVATAAAPPSSC